MNTYKIMIDDRNYSTWSFYNTLTLEKTDLPSINPIKERLFNNDVFQITNDSKNDEIQIVHSTVRISENIPAVLVIEGNKTYGRDKTSKAAKLLYKCIPDDVRLPVFVIPYDIKELGFSKVLTNLYVTIKMTNWSSNHPQGMLTNVIGSVDKLDCFYEYQLYCKSLNASIQKFTKATTSALKNTTHDEIINKISTEYTDIEDRTDSSWQIFTIDPVNSLDYDDGFSVKSISDTRILLSIYISNVTLWLDSLDLWDSFSKRISTIYLPDRKRPMLPTLLSDCLCSLQQDKNRLAFALDLVVDMREGGTIICHNFRNCLIRIYKNYTYEQCDLLKDPNYSTLMSVGRHLTKKFKYINGIKNSHDLVCYLMILMNFYSATEMLLSNNGIFRSSTINVRGEIDLPKELPEDVSRFITIWNSTAGQYIDMSKIENISELRHEMMALDSYIHITSPIRRLVDLLNMIQFQKNKNMLTLSDKAYEFYNKWLQELEYINVTMRAIRRVQCECSLLDTCVNNPDILEKLYDGYCFDRLERNDGLYQYIVYLPELKLTSRITLRDSFNNFEKHNYKLFLFNDEEHFKKKIRLQLV
jgi:hypothetical protein